MMRVFYLLFMLTAISVSAGNHLQPLAKLEPWSVARHWNEAILFCIRNDYARPTVVARNLYHSSLAMWDAWAAFSEQETGLIFKEKIKVADSKLKMDREEAISYAAFAILNERYKSAPNAKKIQGHLIATMYTLGFDPTDKVKTGTSPSAVGLRVADAVLEFAKSDGSREEFNYSSPVGQYLPFNQPLIVSEQGVGTIFNINLWQPLALDRSFDQSGFRIPTKIQVSLTPFWGQVKPFALKEDDKSSTKPGVYFDPGPPPALLGEGDQEMRSATEEVIEYSSWLDPSDSATVDISPASMGNNSLGTNDGHGYAQNPVTGRPYAPQVVNRGDFARSLAEFWADGPDSEAPPGHWNTIANYVSYHPRFVRRWGGHSRILDALEWDVKMYLVLNGALHDTAITAWGIKGYYQGSRPISVIRFQAAMGQSSDPNLPSYHPAGLRLRPGLIELITIETTQPGGPHQDLSGMEGMIALKAWSRPLNFREGEDVVDQPWGAKWIAGVRWQPYQLATFVTPPFPGYISGHSTYSRTAAEVLTYVTGSKFFPGGMGEFKIPVNFLRFEPGPSQELTLQWASYYDAADQSAKSRIFGGIHGYIDDFPGRRLGVKISERAIEKSKEVFRH